MKLLWLDLESTGLDPQKNRILEVAARLATLEAPFETLASYEAVLGVQSRGHLLHPKVVEMHTRNGLWAECEKAIVTLGQVEGDLLRLLRMGESAAPSFEHLQHIAVDDHVQDGVEVRVHSVDRVFVLDKKSEVPLDGFGVHRTHSGHGRWIEKLEAYEDKPTLAGASVHFDLGFLRVHMPRLARELSHRVYDVSAVALFCRSLGMPKLPKAEAHRAMPDVLESIEHAKMCAAWLGKGAVAALQPGKQISAP